VLLTWLLWCPQFLQFNIANMGDSNVTNYQKAVQGTGKNAIFNTLGESTGAMAAMHRCCQHTLRRQAGQPDHYGTRTCHGLLADLQ
jgi:hypothetical protein